VCCAQRFARANKRSSKVAVDSRFAAVLTDSRFTDAAREWLLPPPPPVPYPRTCLLPAATSASKRPRPDGAEAADKPAPKGKGSGASGAGRPSAKRQRVEGASAAAAAGSGSGVGGKRSNADMRALYRLEGADEDVDERGGVYSDGSSDAGGAGGGRGGGMRDLDRLLPGTQASAKLSAVEARLARLNRMARGEMLDDDRASESSTDDEDEAQLDDDEYAAKLAGELNKDTELVIDPDAPDLGAIEYIPDGSETARLAVVNCDWENLRAVDFLAALASFAPPGGSIRRVTVYPSDYGVRKMAEEASEGPISLLKAQYESYRAAGGQRLAGAGEAPADADEDAEEEESEEAIMAALSRPRHAPGGHARQDAFDPIKLRAYELNKMKYYYAVVECDTVATAIGIYANCDGMELEATSNVLDLRFVPEDAAFTNAPRDTATSVPADYEPPQFATAALQSSHVELTWDGDDPIRKRALDWDKLKAAAGATTAGKGKKGRKGRKGRRSGGDDDDRERDEDSEGEGALANVAAYLASSSSSESDTTEEEEEGLGEAGDDGDVAIGGRASTGRMSKAERREADRARLRSLLLSDDSDATGDDVSGGDGSGGEVEDDEAGVSHARRPSGGGKTAKDVLSISFRPGLGDDVVERTRKAKSASRETAWESYQRKRQELRKAKKAAAREQRKQARGSAGATAAPAAPDTHDGAEDGFLVPAEAAESTTVSGPSKGKRKGKSAREDDTAHGDNAADGVDAAKDAERLRLLVGRDGEGDSDGGEGGGGGRNFDLRTLKREAKEADRAAAKAARAKGGRARPAADAEESTAPPPRLSATGGAGFHVDTADARFTAAVAGNAEFAIDPNAPQFRRTAGSYALLAARAKNSSGSDARSAAAQAAGARKSRPMVVVGTSDAATSGVGGVGGGAAPVPASGMDGSGGDGGEGVGDTKALAASVARKFGAKR